MSHKRMDTNAHVQRSSAKVYGVLLLLYPRAYLRTHREELLQNFEDVERDATSGSAFWTFIIGDLITSLRKEYMHFIKQNRAVQLLLALVFILAVIAAWQIATLRIAHSSFDNYAAFRGCETVTSRTGSMGTCTTNAGQSITIVKYDGRWFLKGDLPVCMIGFGSFCLVHQP